MMFKKRQPVDLVCAFVYLRQTRVAPGTLDSVRMQVAMITHEFHRLVADFKRA